MNVVDGKPTVREAVAAALSDGSLDRAAALGSAQLLRDDEGHVRAKEVDQGMFERDGRDLGLELAALLLRAKYAKDHRGVPLANFRFALRLRARAKRRLKFRARTDHVLIALASQSIAEWIADRCERCAGTGIRGARMGGMDEFMKACTGCRGDDGKPTGMVAYAPRGVQPDGAPSSQAAAFLRSLDAREAALYEAMADAGGRGRITIQCPACRGMRYTLQRNRVHHRLGRICQACAGAGDAQPRYADRAIALAISRETYTRIWHRWFVWAGGHLTALDRTLVSSLRCELGRGYSPAAP